MKKFCLELFCILISCVGLSSCAKDKVSVPDPIFRMIEAQSHWGEDCFDCSELHRVDEYLYYGDRVFIFIMSSGGWSMLNLRYAYLYDRYGSRMGYCYFNEDDYPLDNPYHMAGCYEDFINNGHFTQTIWSRF